MARHDFRTTSGANGWPASRGRPTAIRPTSATSSASTRRRTRRRRTRRSPRRAARSRRGRSARSRSAPTFSTRPAPKSSPARTSSAGCWRARKARPCRKAIGETVRAGHIFKFFAGEALRLAGEKLPVGAARRRGRDHPRADRRGRAHHAVEFPDRDSGLEDRAGAGVWQHASCSSRPSGRPAAPGRWPRSSPRPALPPGVFNLVMGSRLGRRRNDRQRIRTSTAISFTGSVATGQ